MKLILLGTGNICLLVIKSTAPVGYTAKFRLSLRVANYSRPASRTSHCKKAFSCKRSVAGIAAIKP